MSQAASCPVCGEPIAFIAEAGGQFDCPNQCHATDLDAWRQARTEQLTREIAGYLDEIRSDPRDQPPA